ncbi:TetR/AcrR family transcriptional regulator [Methylobacterium sp. A54F]
MEPGAASVAERVPGTRGRILSASLALFNARGLARVTTAEIAAAADMREGNLQYHFPRKGRLVEALFELFEAEAEAVAAQRPGHPPDAAALLAYQRAWFELMWAWRCFYRDGAAMVELAPDLRGRVRGLRVRTRALARGHLEAAVAAGHMRIGPEALARLLDNAWIVSSHWMSYRRDGPADISQADLDWGFAQVSALFAPYLTEKG